MTPPKKTVWDIEPHTKAKHRILEEYLKAWFPILARWNGRIIYYDGFAGPGIYSGDEKGSPLVALNTAKKHTLNLKELVFVFVEENEDRANNLKEIIRKESLPNNYTCYVEDEQFENALKKTLDNLDENNANIAPTFAFIDPFGITGLPFTLIRRLLLNNKCEVLITFMNSTINRFVRELPERINELIGNPSASSLIESSNNRIDKARELYQASLKEVAKFVRFFEMKDKSNKPIYDLFFATNNDKGHIKMKEAMWKVDASGEFRFSDGINPQQKVLFSPTPQDDLTRILQRKFQGQTVDSKDIFNYTNDETVFLEKHAREALKLLENDGKINVEETKRDGSKRRKDTFPEGVTIKFQMES